MVQLAPLSWLFIFMLFWFGVICMSCIMWWMSRSEYKFTI
uniref:ATP synthase F0 subunit 8 n=1 Tax=Notocrater youngi TaxID=2813390 RepID=A0A894K6A0_9VEST|nr:ATP synthase F0 subunit 8 [Notocrater youngi]